VPDLGSRRAALLDVLGSRAWALGPERPWTDVAGSYRRALRALSLYGHPSSVLDTETHLADLVVTADPDALADLRARALSPLSGLKPDAAERLAQTLRAWLLHQGRRDDVAAELLVHPQTVRYRMGQVRELFGDRLQDPGVVRDLLVALAGSQPTSTGVSGARQHSAVGSASP
jgi:DNA-binding PucR family transcriptional regulator